MPYSAQFSPIISHDITATIAASQTTSGAIDLVGTTLCGMFLPASMTGAKITIEHSATEDGTYSKLYDRFGQEVAITVTAGGAITLDPSIFASLRHIRLVSDAAEAAQRDINLVTRPV